MILIILATVVLNVLSQRNPGFFDKPDYEYRDFLQKVPYQKDGSKLKEQKYIEDQLSQVNPAIFEEMDKNLEKYNKYEEFKQLTDHIKEKTRKDPSRTIQDEINEAFQWSRNLNKPLLNQRGPQMQSWGMNPDRNNFPPGPKPSAGMSAYWAPDEKKTIYSKAGPNTAQPLTGKQIMHLALRKLESIDAIGAKSPMEKFPGIMKSLPKSLPIDLLQVPIETLSKTQITSLNKWQKMDDYNSPVRWVSLDSNDTRDGLAKVTDPHTGRNQQYIINGSIFVPIIDYNIERLGLSTTTNSPVLTTDKKVLRTVQEIVDFKNVDERDWLAFEIVLRGQSESKQGADENNCDGDNCQSRCKTLGCESVCTGDTCASGCVGGHCNTFCQGPGCLAMCIGDNCKAKCQGLACDSRCRGNGCEASCHTFSCIYTVNGRYGRGGGVWNDHYPQYEDKNFKNTQYQ